MFIRSKINACLKPASYTDISPLQLSDKHSASTFMAAIVYSVSHRVLESKTTEEILPTPTRVDNVEVITQSRAQSSCQNPRESISLHLGGSSEVFVELSLCPLGMNSGVPISFIKLCPLGTN